MCYNCPKMRLENVLQFKILPNSWFLSTILRNWGIFRFKIILRRKMKSIGKNAFSSESFFGADFCPNLILWLPFKLSLFLHFFTSNWNILEIHNSINLFVILKKWMWGWIQHETIVYIGHSRFPLPCVFFLQYDSIWNNRVIKYREATREIIWFRTKFYAYRRKCRFL